MRILYTVPSENTTNHNESSASEKDDEISKIARIMHALFVYSEGRFQNSGS